MNFPALESAINIVGLQPLAARLGVSYQAVGKWGARGCLPRTEATGETHYAATIEQATGGVVSAASLLARPVRARSKRAVKRRRDIAPPPVS